ncbi:hypothetical protein D1872_35950 [compost metagenome]
MFLLYCNSIYRLVQYINEEKEGVCTMMITGLEEIKLNTLEYCYTVDKHGTGDDSFKVILPKVMPKISPSIKPVVSSYNNNIFVNAADCKPTTSPKITTQGFYTIKRFKNVNLSHLPSPIPQGTRLISAIMDGNILDVHVTGNI